MGGTRDFSAQQGHAPPLRNIDNDAPQPMRQEILAVAYDLLPNCHGAVTEAQLYYGIVQMLGQQAAGNPMAGWRQRLGRDLANSEWTRIYDVISWLWGQFQRAGLQEVLRQNVNQVLAAHAVVWDLGEDGRLHRVLPAAAQAQVQAAIQELGDARYAPAQALFHAARDAYDDRPRRDRDACMNAFQAVESAAQIRFDMPGRPFDGVLGELRSRGGTNAEVLHVLDSLNVLRHRNFGHGGAEEFALGPAEVDFVYLTCIGAILLFTRTP